MMMFFFYEFYIYTCMFILMDKTIKTWKMNCKYRFTAQHSLYGSNRLSADRE